MAEHVDDQERYSAQMERIEHTLLYISDTKKRAGWKRDELVKMRADQHLIDALDRTIIDLGAVHTKLMQGTYWYVSPEQLEADKVAARARRQSGDSVAAQPELF
jgi:hypothetical protein